MNRGRPSGARSSRPSVPSAGAINNAEINKSGGCCGAVVLKLVVVGILSARVVQER